MTRPKTRAVVAVVTAVCIATTFAGPAAALSIGEAGDEVNLPEQGDSDGTIDVSVDASGDGVDVSVGGQGAAGGEDVSGSIDCSVAPEPPENPEETCVTETPGSDDGPELPEPEPPEQPTLPEPEPPEFANVPGIASFAP